MSKLRPLFLIAFPVWLILCVATYRLLGPQWGGTFLLVALAILLLVGLAAILRSLLKEHQ